MATTLYVGADRPSRIILPICPPADRSRPDFGTAEPRQPGRDRPEPVDQWHNIRDEMSQTATVFRETAVPEHPVPGESIVMSHFERRWCTASDRDPARATLKAEGQRRVRRGRDEIAVNSWLSIESDETAFQVRAKCELTQNGQVVRNGEWDERIRRDGI
jgi:hypothetical protein